MRSVNTAQSPVPKDRWPCACGAQGSEVKHPKTAPLVSDTMSSAAPFDDPAEWRSSVDSDRPSRCVESAAREARVSGGG